MRNKFNEQLSQLNRQLILMGALCEDAISSAVKYLKITGEGGKNADTKSTIRQSVSDTEKQIDQKEREIETLCTRLLLHQQPVAVDLRTVSSALKMISDMERIGDQAADIAEIAEHISKNGFESETHILEMADATIKMVNDSIDSFVRGDVMLANSVIKYDDVVDDLFEKVKSELISSSGKETEALIDLLMIAKYFERIGDHAENIAEWVIYSITGTH